MTEGFLSYLFSVCVSAVLAVFVPNLISKNRIRKIAELAGGLLLLISVLSPIVRLNYEDVRQVMSSYLLDNMDCFEWDNSINQDIVAARISQQCEAYILDKAEAIGMSVDVHVLMNDHPTYPMPVEISISGRYSPWQKEQLSVILAQDFGILPEKQFWR